MSVCVRCGQHSSPGDIRCAGCGAILARSQRPGVGSSYEQAGRALKANLGTLLGVFAISLAWNAAGNVFELPGVPSPWTGFGIAGIMVVLALVILVNYPLAYGVAFTCLKALRDGRPRIRDVFGGFRGYGNTLLAVLATIIPVALGTVLLIIPGIWIAARLAFTQFLVVDRRMPAFAAVKQSWRMTRGYGWTIIGIAAVVFVTTFVVGLALIYAMKTTPASVAGVVVQTFTTTAMLMGLWFGLAALYYGVVGPGGADGQSPRLP